MANTPKKMKDPTEAALSASQDALHVRDDEPGQSQGTSSSNALIHSDDGASEAPWPGLRSKGAAKADLFDEEVRRPDDTGSLRRPAANDDRESIGTILRSLQQRPDNTSYLVAIIFSGVWEVGGFAISWLY